MYHVIQGSMSMVTAFTPATVETMRGHASYPPQCLHSWTPRRRPIATLADGVVIHAQTKEGKIYIYNIYNNLA